MDLHAEGLAILRLARTPGVGMATFRKALARCGSACEIVRQWDTLTQGKRPLATEDSLRREGEQLTRLGGCMLVWGDKDYPDALHPLPDAPLVLSVLGDARLLHGRQVAVVGNRSASAHGMRWTEDLCRTLAREVTITSGLARGIDTAAHTGALASGTTIAVVAGGVDHIYPPENAALRARIIAAGCVVSEQPLGTAPTAHLFPRRNRIIAGLSVGVLVAEASRHSGSLITAEQALEYGRNVWAVPGTPGDVRSSGPNHLLKQGAQLVEDATDILRDLPHKPAPFVQRAAAVQQDMFAPPALAAGDAAEETPPGGSGTVRETVWSLLGRTGVSFEEILRQGTADHAGLDAITLQATLSELELDGLAQRDPLGAWCRA